MEKTETYYFHQTPSALGKDLIGTLHLEPTDILFEPFKGEGAFFNHFPEANPKVWAEITEGKDFRSVQEPYDWVITNPPFRLEDTPGKRKNAIFEILEYFLERSRKGVAFLISDYGLGTLTPKRRKKIAESGWILSKIVMCQVKKWRGRYYFVVFTKTGSDVLSYLETSY